MRPPRPPPYAGQSDSEVGTLPADFDREPRSGSEVKMRRRLALPTFAPRQCCFQSARLRTARRSRLASSLPPPALPASELHPPSLAGLRWPRDATCKESPCSARRVSQLPASSAALPDGNVAALPRARRCPSAVCGRPSLPQLAAGSVSRLRRVLPLPVDFSSLIRASVLANVRACRRNWTGFALATRCDLRRLNLSVATSF